MLKVIIADSRAKKTMIIILCLLLIIRYERYS